MISRTENLSLLPLLCPRSFLLKVRERSLGFGFVAYSLLSERGASAARADSARTDDDQDQLLSCSTWIFSLWKDEDDTILELTM